MQSFCVCDAQAATPADGMLAVVVVAGVLAGAAVEGADVLAALDSTLELLALLPQPPATSSGPPQDNTTIMSLRAGARTTHNLYE
jgi:hypothetical protein